MSLSEGSNIPENKLLGALPAQEYQRILPHLEPVSLSLHQHLYEANEPIEQVYFPNKAIVSLVLTLKDRSMVEVSMVGNEGMVGIPVIWGGNSTTHQAIVQIAGGAMQMNANQLKTEFERGGGLKRLLLRYTQAQYTQVSQTAICNRLHTVEERLARWLLSVQDRLQSNQLPLTQEYISRMLGTRRAGVTVAAGTLSQAGMIRYSRGKITILNRKDLEATSCECYKLLKTEFDRLLAPRHS